jgi:hypothetical protein
MSEICHCGKPLHYTDPLIEIRMRGMVSMLGELIRVTVNGRTWLVPRHYIALHGLNGKDVAALGFEELKQGGRLPDAAGQS